MKLTFRRIALACLALGAAYAGPALARLDPDHPAVARALAHLQRADAATLAGAGHAYQLRDVIVDADGSEHVRFARSFQGLPVIGGDLVVHGTAQGALRHISQTLKSAPTLDVRATVGEADAIARATSAFGGTLKAPASAHLAVYARDAKPRLAYDVKLRGVRANGAPSIAHLIVDAHSARVLDRWDDIHTADAVGTGTTLYSGTVSIHTDSQTSDFALRDLTRGSHFVEDLKGKDAYFGNPKGTLMVDVDNVWGDGVQSNKSQSDGVDAMYGFAVTWDFYQSLGRNGIADDGRGAKSRVHAKNWGGALYNAFWDDDCFCMTYTNWAGVGNGALVSLDVAGHEMSHGVTSNTAGLIYSGESGGLNEGTSDIMGAMVERFAKNANDPADYLIGEEPFAGSFLRSMIQPSLDGASADCYYAGVGGLDVHYSSGVANHMFYILANGSQPAGGAASPTCQAGDTRVATGNAVVKGVGANAATKIYYRALSVYMTTDTTFADARAAMVSAATDLYGATSPKVQGVKDAWTAVNVN